MEVFTLLATAPMMAPEPTIGAQMRTGMMELDAATKALGAVRGMGELLELAMFAAGARRRKPERMQEALVERERAPGMLMI